MILDYMQSLKDQNLSDCTLEVYFRVLRLLYKYLEDEQRIFVDPTTGLNYVVKKRLKAAPTEEVITAVMDSVDTSTPAGVRNRAMLEVLYGTGVRREELVVMNTEDIDLDVGTIKIRGKGGKERLVPVGDHLGEWLRRYMVDAKPKLMFEAETKALWVMQGGGRLGYSSIHQVLRVCKARIGMTERLTVHDFRRAFATHMLQNGASPIELQALLGHSTLKHLSYYLRLTIKDMKKMHAASRVGQ